MKLRRILSLATALLLVTSLPLAAFADDWSLNHGDITISVTESGQTVSQGETSKSDSAPIITGGNDAQTITVTTTDNTEANLTIRDISAKTIDVGDSNAIITVEGWGSSIGGVNNDAGIHVSSGSLTITGESCELEVIATRTPGQNACIGSNGGEAMSGSITIAGKVGVTIKRNDGSGAGIGSGAGGDMSGKINIEDNANVTATGSSGAGIGSGEKGEMSGTITNSTRGTVNASSISERSEDDTQGDNTGAGGEVTNTGTTQYFDPEPKDTKTTALYRVVDDNGISMGYTSAVKDGVLTITVKGDYARLTGSVASLATLASWGYNAITLVTDNATSTFALADLQAKGPGTYTLTHSGQEVTLTLNGEALTGILK